MPPLKTFVFVNIYTDYVKIEIFAYELITAQLILNKIVKDFENYKLKQ